MCPDTPIVLSKEEFKHYNKDGILLGDDSGYLATITMYHDMHCIVSSQLSKPSRSLILSSDIFIKPSTPTTIFLIRLNMVVLLEGTIAVYIYTLFTL